MFVMNHLQKRFTYIVLEPMSFILHQNVMDRPVHKPFMLSELVAFQVKLDILVIMGLITLVYVVLQQTLD